MVQPLLDSFRTWNGHHPRDVSRPRRQDDVAQDRKRQES